MKVKHIIKYIGYLLGVLSFYYIYLAIKNSELNWQFVQQSIQGLDFLLILSTLILYILVMFLGGTLWAWFIKILSSEKIINYQTIILIHAKTNLAKYLPGNFLHLIGRNVLAHQLGFKNTKVALASMFEMLYLLIVGSLIVVYLYLFDLINLPLKQSQFITDNSFHFIVFLIIFFSLMAILLRKKIAHFVNLYSLKEFLIHSWIVALVGYLLAYLLLGMSNVIVFAVLSDNTLSKIDYFNIIFIYILSWLLGFIVPGPPGGLGVREALYIFLLSSQYDLILATAMAILLRLMNIAGDIFYFLISMTLFSGNNTTKN